jgi:hypothetical protein
MRVLLRGSAETECPSVERLFAGIYLRGVNLLMLGKRRLMVFQAGAAYVTLPEALGKVTLVAKDAGPPPQPFLGIHTSPAMCLIRSMLQLDLFTPPSPRRPIGMTDVVRTVAKHSKRPRYTFMVLDLIARVARSDGEAGPLVRAGEALVPIREWLAATIAPSAARYHQRRATVEKVRAGLLAAGELPCDPAEAECLVEKLVGERVLESGMTAVSRAVSELVSAGLITRHYQGYCVDHENRGAQRQAVYTVAKDVLAALRPDLGKHASFTPSDSFAIHNRARAARQVR